MMRSKKKPLIYGISDQTNLDKYLLAAIFLMGAFAIIFLKVAFFKINLNSLFYDFLPSIVSAGLLFLYAIICSSFFRYRLEPDEIGDNCYYLGFLFTLTSLGVTLYFISSVGDLADTNDQFIRDVISGFGVALSSTIVGIALRVFFLQMRGGIVSRERESRVELDQAVREFTQSLSRTLSTFRGFSTEINQSWREHSERMIETSERDFKEIFKHIESQFSTLISEAKQTNASVSKELESSILQALAKVSDGNSDYTRKLLAEISSSSSNAVEVVENFSKSFRELSDTTDEHRRQIAELKSETDKAIRHNTQKLTSLVDDIEKTKEETNRTTGELYSELKKTASTIKGSLTEAGRLLSNTMADARSEVSSFTEETRQASEEIQKHRKESQGETPLPQIKSRFWRS